MKNGNRLTRSSQSLTPQALADLAVVVVVEARPERRAVVMKDDRLTMMKGNRLTRSWQSLTPLALADLAVVVAVEADPERSVVVLSW
jgi:hypothetical protein